MPLHRWFLNLMQAGQIMARACIANMTDHASIEFKRTEIGRPYFECDGEPCKGIDFNISHQGKYVGLIFADDGSRVGIDIVDGQEHNNQTWNEFIQPFEIHVSSLEMDWILENDDERYTRFYCLWALKECVVKALGVGISSNLVIHNFKLAAFDIVGLSREIEYLMDGQVQDDWTITISWIDTRHISAIAINRKNYDVPAPTFVSWDSIVEML